MTSDEWIKTILGNGAIGAAVGAAALWIFNGTLAKKARRSDYIREQIRNLYGPVTFLLEKGDRAFEVHNTIMAGYHEYFADRHGEHFSEQMTLVIGIQNEYGQLVKDANTESVAIIKANWGWLDADDGIAVRDFLTYVDRLALEFDQESKARLPLEFYGGLKNRLRAPIVYDARLVKRFRQKLEAKQAELEGRKPPKVPPETQPRVTDS